MIDTETLNALSQGPAITAASLAVDNALPDAAGVLALPANFQTHDLERMLACRRRARGTMHTSVIAHFARYVGAHLEEGGSVFVDPAKMTATAVLNLGSPSTPGHADNTASLTPMATAAYAALIAATTGAPKSQKDLAEFLEDWASFVTCWRAGDPMEHRHAVAAIRRITIESLSRTESTVEQLSASRSAFDQVKAAGGDLAPPTMIEFHCEPYVGIEGRTFGLRLAILTEGKAPTITLRIVRREEHVEQMAAELVDAVVAAIGGVAPVLIGSYSAKT